ncbi:hypothetical protein [Massilia sp. 9096]|uniref:hypothetical protein n=1 Tax=Massilia sp. 9096 TaxID=1500894 RepID=UPI000AE49238|nr:hypothetical protein [Massilia sp. 9096]
MSTSNAQQANCVSDGPSYLSIGEKLVATEVSLAVINPAMGNALEAHPAEQARLGTGHGDEGRQLFTNPKTILIHK